MIFCQIHGVDRDRCECPIDYTRNEYHDSLLPPALKEKGTVVEQIKQKAAELVKLCETLTAQT